MKKFILGILISAATICSCSVDPVPESTDPVASYIRATLESSATKTVLDKSGNVLWEDDDWIYVYCNEWDAEYCFDTSLSSPGSTSGVFTWDNYYFSPRESCDTEPVFSKGSRYYAECPMRLDYWDTEQSYSETIEYLPMKAESVADGDGAVAFSFNNLGGILRLTVKGSGTVASVRLDVDEIISGKIISIEKGSDGKFIAVMGSSSASGESYVELDCGSGVALSDEGTVFLFSLPCCAYKQDNGNVVIDEYTGVTITLTDTDGNKRVKRLKGSLVIERSMITEASFSIPGFVPDGGIDSKFSVSDTKQVCFSKGNLYWDGDSFEFETNQYDFPSTWNDFHVGHFYWSGTPSVAYGEDYSDSAASTSDVLFTEESGFTANGQTGTWRTLTLDEWAYLLSNNGYALATVNDVPGAILFCDGYSGARTGLASIPDGCVFLPFASYRLLQGVSDNREAAYWSSEPDSSDITKAGRVLIIDVLNRYMDTGGRDAGFCIRLVHDYSR